MSISTSRLQLTTHEPDDAQALVRWQSDPELLWFNSDEPTPRPAERVRGALDRWIAGSESARFFAVRLSSGELVGFAHLAAIDTFNRSCMLGLTIGERELWGRGLGREVVGALVDYAFDEVGLHRVGAEVFSFNERAIRLFRSAGFEAEGLIRESVRRDDRFYDTLVFGRLETDASLPT